MNFGKDIKGENGKGKKKSYKLRFKTELEKADFEAYKIYMNTYIYGQWRS